MRFRNLALWLLCVAFVFTALPLFAAEGQNRLKTLGYAAMRAKGPLVPYEFELREVNDDEILLDILYAGLCHSDIHIVDEDWGSFTGFPFVPGHEIAGKVAAVGKNVTKFKVGDIAGVGALLDSCGECEFSIGGQEQYCEKGALTTTGGYAKNIVVKERYALTIPKSIPLEKVAPLLCAGITSYSPIFKLDIKKGDKVAVAGLGGVGHMALQYAVSMGADVTVFEVTDAKAESAKKLGAVEYVNTRKNPKALDDHQNKFKAILSTIPVKYELQPFINALRSTGTFVIIGMPATDQSGATFDLNTVSLNGRMIMGTCVGGIKETQEMLDYSAEHKIYPEIEVIQANEINEAFEKIKNGDVQFRYVVDVSTMKL
jgi:uncharacterized zinc-type alcohol dehydrogenase-like protein